ncbi:MAG: VanZ family protein [Betaproteobacteria bacterium]|nr:VanZ family protein [Betaproteobacteria bacterium]
MTRGSHRSLWLAVGWFGVAVVVYFTLIPDPPQLDMEDGDKVQHLVAYACLMAWFAQARAPGAHRRTTGLLLVAMGILLEFAQGLTGYRFMSLADMAANTAGVALGWFAAPPRLPDVYTWSANLLSRR